MPIHPTPISCEVCNIGTTLSNEGLTPPGWILVEATETVIQEAPPVELPEFAALPAEAPEQFAQYVDQLQTIIGGLLEERAATGPTVIRLKGTAVYCPNHAGGLQTKLDFPDRDEWVGAEDDFDEEG